MRFAGIGKAAESATVHAGRSGRNGASPAGVGQGRRGCGFKLEDLERHLTVLEEKLFAVCTQRANETLLQVRVPLTANLLLRRKMPRRSNNCTSNS